MAFSRLLIMLLTVALSCPPCGLAQNVLSAMRNWRELASPQSVWPADGAAYYNLQTPGGTRVHLLVVDMKSGEWTITPAVNETNTPVSVCAEKYGASAAVNAGYFNLTDGLSTSYVVVDGKLLADPSKNKALTDNPRLKPFMSLILNRSELRLLRNGKGELRLQIARHRDPLPEGWTLVHSIQAGPRLLPKLTTREEAFIRRDPDGKEVVGISALKPAARTAFGITDDGYAVLLCAASARQDPESHGLTLQELADLLKNLGCSEAINFDGGSSTTLFVRLSGGTNPESTASPPGHVVCGRVPETLVKSVLLLKRISR